MWVRTGAKNKFQAGLAWEKSLYTGSLPMEKETLCYLNTCMKLFLPLSVSTIKKVLVKF